MLVAVAVALCRGWLLAADPTFPERDAGFSALALQHLQAALAGHGDWTETPMGWPLTGGTTRADWMLGQAILGLPLRLLAVDPSRIYQLVSFFGLVLSAWACHRVARRLLGPGPHTLVAGLIGGLGPLALQHAQHANLVHQEWAVAAGAGLAVGIGERRPWVAALGGACVAIGFHFGLYMGLHAALVGALVCGGLAWGRHGSRLAWGAAAAGFGVVLATLVPVALLYGRAAQSTSLSVGELLSGAWDPGTSLALTLDAPAHTWIAAHAPFRMLRSPESANPGFVALGLAVVGLRACWPLRGAWRIILAVGLSAAVLALGSAPHWQAHVLPFPGPNWIFEALAGGNLRSPIRWLVLSHAAIGLFAAAGMAAITGRAPAWARDLLAAPLLLAMVLELPSRPPEAAVKTSPAWCLLDGVDTDGALFESFGNRCACSGTARLRAALFHGRPLVGGNYARMPAALDAVNKLLYSWPSPESQVFLRAVEARVVLEHPPLRGPPPPGAQCTESHAHRLCVLPAPTARVPAPAAVTTSPGGPVIGLRWETAPAGRTVRFQCGDAAPTDLYIEPWRVLAKVRDVATTDVFLDAACADAWTVSDGAPVALYLDPAHAADTWLPPVPERGGTIADMVPGGCPVRQ